MLLSRRVRTVYRKELLDILRDHRTLIAMIVVPIVLYPLLTLGSLQLVTMQVSELDEQPTRMGVLVEGHATGVLQPMIAADAQLAQLAREEQHAEPGASGDDPDRADQRGAASAGKLGEVLPELSRTAATDPGPPTAGRVSQEPFDPELVQYSQWVSRDALAEAVRNRSIHVGVILPEAGIVNELNQGNEVELLFDSGEVRSRLAARRLEAVFERTGDRIVRHRLEAAQLPAQFVAPFTMARVDLTSPQSILGEILPLILVLMTITGAIYPAIDLTAGERERGTLESLLVCPVPALDVIVGKFLVVTTVAIVGAALNLGSMSATVYLGGFSKLFPEGSGGPPLIRLALILVYLVPFAVLMSAIMIAVCSCARSFKEAQNYVMPVILAVLVPGGLAALPTAQFEGIMLVLPVGSMVLLAREMLLGSLVPWWKIALVLGSTTLYAGSAVAVAAQVFGRESIVFADAGSGGLGLSRTHMRPRWYASVSMVLLLTALLFPTWFFVQASQSPEAGEDASSLLRTSAMLMPAVFVLLPIAVLAYFKVDLRSALRLRMPSFAHLLAGALLGVSLWVPASELTVLQQSVLPIPESALRNLEVLAATLQALPLPILILYIALVPAVCEELYFRGFLLGGLLPTWRPLPAIVVTAIVFGVFHFVLFKFAVTALLGLVLGVVCWRSRSVLPGMLAHFLHNGLQAMHVAVPDFAVRLGIDPESTSGHLPVHLLVIGLVLLVVAGLLLTTGCKQPTDESADH